MNEISLYWHVLFIFSTLFVGLFIGAIGFSVLGAPDADVRIAGVVMAVIGLLVMVADFGFVIQNLIRQI